MEKTTEREQPTIEQINTRPKKEVSRRGLLFSAGVTFAAAIGVGWLERHSGTHGNVFIAKNQRYDGSLVATIRDGLRLTGIDTKLLKGKRVLLKPNLVEPTRAIPHMTTHPAVIIAAAEVFRSLGASVTVGEAPGHVRDTEMALIESGVAEALENENLPFADLNYQDVGWTENRGNCSPLKGIYFPQSVLESDLIVSLPKMKTHHWVGMTASMKNMYGVLPGIKYGWPKNVLHHAGIPQTVVDINASLPSLITIVDGIDCMEGDGPILGSKKHMGLILVGNNLQAVDATMARIMGLNPLKISYLRMSGDRRFGTVLGPLKERKIHQRGESWKSVASPFQVLKHLDGLRAGGGPLVT